MLAAQALLFEQRLEGRMAAPAEQRKANDFLAHFDRPICGERDEIVEFARGLDRFR
ncbi:MAG: hypothetical protein HY053_02145 [Proteobacteria bacterium]|nr:hypothetical protein [Pseudomonadota bacterium]